MMAEKEMLFRVYLQSKVQENLLYSFVIYFIKKVAG